MSVEIPYDEDIVLVVCAEKEVEVGRVSWRAARGGRDVDIDDFEFVVVWAD